MRPVSFGRNKNMVRRPTRPDGQFHRMRRRRALNHPLAQGDSLLASLLHLLATPFRKRKY